MTHFTDTMALGTVGKLDKEDKLLSTDSSQGKMHRYNDAQNRQYNLPYVHVVPNLPGLSLTQVQFGVSFKSRPLVPSSITQMAPSLSSRIPRMRLPIEMR